MMDPGDPPDWLFDGDEEPPRQRGAQVLKFEQKGVVPVAIGPQRQVRPFFDWVDAAELARPLPPIPWVCQGLEFAPGAPLLFAGYGGSGKSMVAQWLALSVASGEPFANLEVRQGGVLHFDWEQGLRLTSERYQRMAHARGIGLASLPLSLASHPREGLLAPKAEESLLRDCEGRALGIVDSLAVASAGLDENSTEIRRPLDLLTRVSERTGISWMVIHHAKKTKQEDAQQVDVRQLVRGSSGIFDACSSVFVMQGQAGKPATCSHVKARVRGRLQSDLLISPIDLEDGGLELSVSAAAPVGSANVSNEVLIGRIATYLMANPGSPKDGIKARVTGRAGAIVVCLNAMVAEGLVRVEGSGVRGDPERYWVVELKR